ncbi:hypothetical protein BDD21_2882 [Thiocapsa rosea]|uniref:Uncharacterized protein n=1 Tax=Thiocapsa rosea TaxID=69360 RepID=A0A495V7P0_9GAMM|nr:hypothetical protein BDD21_2882 [Thiocapsa rosea]
MSADSSEFDLWSIRSPWQGRGFAWRLVYPRRDAGSVARDALSASAAPGTPCGPALPVSPKEARPSGP